MLVSVENTLFQMNVGFVTASGKGVKISEEALERARKLFREVDSTADECAKTSEAVQNTCSNGTR